MKKSITQLAMAILISASLVACGGDTTQGNGGPPLTVNEDGTSSFDSTQLAANLASLPIEALNEAETTSLTYLREEEKLALDVYTQLNSTWGASIRVFGNIANSEATHTEAVRQLLLRYNLTDPTLNLGAGRFFNATLQSLYTTLVNQGATSLIAALQVGAAIEELDIMDIRQALVGIDNQDIRLVYENLEKGSRNHLRSFVNNLQQRGVTYSPQYLDAAAYTAIVTSPTER